MRSLPLRLPDVKWVWGELDRVWAEYGLDNRLELSGQKIGEYYSHPVWLMNGIFTALDPESYSHRTKIGQFLGLLDVERVADYGGGFGELALSIARCAPKAKVSIIEPYPSSVGLERIGKESRIEFSKGLVSSEFDAAIGQDVLEHVEDPVLLAYELADAVKTGGYVVFANCFHSVIQCHVPCTFHLRHTFPWIMKSMGLSFIGVIEGAPHVQVFRRCDQLSLERARKAEKWSRKLRALSVVVGPLISYAVKQRQRIVYSDKNL